MICTVQDILTRKSIEATSDITDILTAIVAGVTAQFESFCRRKIVAANYTEYQTGRAGDQLHVDCWPIVSITSIKEALDYDFANAQALVVNTDYRLIKNGLSGIIKRLYGNWPEQPDTIEIVYRGGYAAAGTTPGTGELAMPSDLRELAIIECCNRYNQRNDYGVSSVDYDNGSATRLDNRPFLEQVVVGLENWKRIH